MYELMCREVGHALSSEGDKAIEVPYIGNFIPNVDKTWFIPSLFIQEKASLKPMDLSPNKEILSLEKFLKPL